MIDFLIKNYLIILVLFIIILGVTKVYKKSRSFYENKKTQIIKAWFRIIAPVILFIGLIYLHHQYSLIEIQVKESLILVISILTMYGIFYGFIQFAISYSIQNKNDKYWGRNITRYLLTKNVWFATFNSLLFKLMLIYITIIPIINNSSEELSRLFTNDLLIVVWDASVVCVIILYVFLFIKSLSIMNDFFYMQEGLGWSMKFSIESEVKNKCNDNFKESYEKKTNFPAILFTQIGLAEEYHRKEMFTAIIESITDTNIQVINKEQINQVGYYLRRFREIFTSDELKQLDLSVKELLESHGLMEKFIHCEINNIKTDESREINDRIIGLYIDRGNSYQRDGYYDIPQIIWDNIKQYEDILEIQKYIKGKMDKYSPPVVLDDQEKIKLWNRSYGQSIYKVLNYSSRYVKDIEARRIPNYISDFEDLLNTKNNKDIVSFQFYYYIMNLEFTTENKLYIQLLVDSLTYEQQVSFVFYIMLYPNPTTDIKRQQDVLFFHKIMGGNRKRMNVKASEVKENVIQEIVENDDSYLSHINRRIDRPLIEWVFDNLDTQTSYIKFIQSCLDEDHLTYLDMLKLKFIFDKTQYNYVSFTGFSFHKVKQSPYEKDWRIGFYLELLGTPELFKVNFFRRHLHELLKDINFASMPRGYLDIEDFRLYVLSQRFQIEENDFRELIEIYHFVSDGVIEFLSLRLDEKPYEYVLKNKDLLAVFIREVTSIMSVKNVNVEGYVSGLAEKLNEISYDSFLPLLKKEKIIRILRGLIE